MERIRLLLVDDEPSVRRGLRMRLELEADVEVIGEAADGAAAVEMTAQLGPTVVLMDIQMPVLNGILATRQITQESPASAVIVLSMHDDAATIGQARDAGASEFIAKHSMDDTLITAIRRAAGEKGALTSDSGPCARTEITPND
jgi:DNA-binding NarL/FixJ family response regulator